MESAVLHVCNVKLLLQGHKIFVKDRGSIQRTLPASNLNNCIPGLSVPFMAFRAVSRFAHDLMWWACQLFHAGNDLASSKSPKRLDPEKPRSEMVEVVNALPTELLGMYDIFLLPPHDVPPSPVGIMVSLTQC